MSLGHRHIGLITGRLLHGKDPREVAFETYLRRRDLFRNDAVRICEWSVNGGYEAMMESLSGSEFPSAFFVASDPMAIGAMKALQMAGKRVPEDVALVGFDDIEMAKFVTPSLTTVSINSELMGRLSVRLAINPIDDETPLRLIVPHELVIRESCGATRAKRWK